MRSRPVWSCLLVALSIAAPSRAEELPGNEALVDRLLGEDVAASREAACQMAHRGKDALAALEERLAGMKSIPKDQEERAASALSVAMLFTVQRTEIAAWPRLTALAGPRSDAGREIAKRLIEASRKFHQEGNVPHTQAPREPSALALDTQALLRLQGFALEGIADLCASEDPEDRAYGVEMIARLNAFAEQATLDRLSQDTGSYHWFDGCCGHDDSVAEKVAELWKVHSYWVARKETASALNRVAAEAELMAESLQTLLHGESPTFALLNGLRQAGAPKSWDATTWDEWWDRARPAWNVWWSEFADKEQTRELYVAWSKRVQELNEGGK